MRLARLTLVFTLVALTACEETASGRKQLALIPDSVMTDIGEETFAQMKAEQTLASDPRTNELVQCVAGELIEAAKAMHAAEDLPESWEIAVFQNPTPNAFALPGGRIGVHSGLLGVAKTADQLAAVIGHEVAHVLAEHGNERMTHALGFQAVMFVAGFFGENSEEQQLIRQLLGLGSHFGVALPFSRHHEKEADVLGLQMMAAAGFTPQASIELWRNMAAASGAQPLEFLSTHPAHDTRIERLQANMGDADQRYASATPARCGN